MWAKKICQRSEPRVWGVERVAEPGDMPLMSPFHDTRFWYHALMSSVDSSIALFQYLALTIQEKIFKIGFLASNKNFLVRIFAYTLASKKRKKYACDLLQKE